IMRSAERDLLRSGRSRLAAIEITTTEYENQRESLQAAIADQRGAEIDPDLAFATTAGRPPWESGLIGACVALVLTLPLTLYHQWPLGKSPFEILYAARSLLTLPVLGFVFGYFYPRVRGDQPLAKASYLLVVALLLQLSTKLPQLTGPALPVND